MDTLILNGHDLTLQDVYDVAYDGRKVEIAADAYARLAKGREIMQELSKGGKAIYGFNRGVGQNKDVTIDEDFMETQNRMMLRSHSLGLPPFNTDEEVRAMMVIRLNNMLIGASCASDDLANSYRDFLNHGITPRIPRRGAVGEADITTITHIGLAFIGEEDVNYKGKVVVDRGLAGASKTSEMYQAALDVFAQYPDIEIVAEFDGNFTYSDTLSAMESIIAAQPQIDAVYTCGYADGAIDAFVDAGLKPVPTCGFYYNSSALAMLEHDVPALLILNPASLSATAMQMALDELNGVTTYQREELITPEYALYSNYPDIADVGMPVEKLEEGVNCFKDMAGGFQLPVVDSSVGVEVPLELFK